jgi:hypothetical protein
LLENAAVRVVGGRDRSRVQEGVRLLETARGLGADLVRVGPPAVLPTLGGAGRGGEERRQEERAAERRGGRAEPSGARVGSQNSSSIA